jgi:hypothetical protein
MHTKRVVITLLPLLVGSMLAWPAMGQSTGPVDFDSTEAALAGSYACNGGNTIQFAPVDASTTGVSGLNANQGANLSGTTCGLPLYSIQSASDSTSAQDSPTQDDGAGNGAVQNVSLLGGVVTYQSLSEGDSCGTTDGVTITCSDTTTITNLKVGGQSVTGTFTSPATYNLVDVGVLDPGCLGAETFTGMVTIASASSLVSPGGQSATATMAPVRVDGTLTCLGLPLVSEQVHLQDVYNGILFLVLPGSRSLDVTITESVDAD